MKKTILFTVLFLAIVGKSFAQNKKSDSKKMETTEHYTFKLSDKVTRAAVTFKNRYGITLSGDLYLPKNAGNEKLSALAISGPFGAKTNVSSNTFVDDLIRLIQIKQELAIPNLALNFS